MFTKNVLSRNVRHTPKIRIFKRQMNKNVANRFGINNNCTKLSYDVVGILQPIFSNKKTKTNYEHGVDIFPITSSTPFETKYKFKFYTAKYSIRVCINEIYMHTHTHKYIYILK